MTELREVFHTYCDISSQHRPVEGIEGTLVYVKGIGHVVIKIFIDGQEEISVVKDVLHVPGLGRNLFSISRASKRDINTIHSKNGARLELKGAVTMRGIQEQGLYRLFFEAIHPIAGTMPMITSSAAQAFAAASLGVKVKKEATRSLDIWHKGWDM